MALPIGFCGQFSIIASISPSLRFAISADILGSTIISRPNWKRRSREDDLIWVHDYHLIPLADALRRRGHANRIGFFLHVPFPSPEILTSLPKHEQLIPLLMQYDVIGFQTDGDAANFARYLLSECNPNRELRLFAQGNRQIKVGVSGKQTLIGTVSRRELKPGIFQRLARGNARSASVKRTVESLGGRVLMIGVDRLDYSKGLIQRLDAFDSFCQITANGSAR